MGVTTLLNRLLPTRSTPAKPATTVAVAVSAPAPAPGPAPPTALSLFLANAKQQLQAKMDAKESLADTVIVVGNEAGDLDSLSSAISFAYFSSVTSPSPSPLYVPLLYTQRADLYLRPENVAALTSSSIDPTHLLFLSDISPSSLAHLGVSFALVDHNRLLPIFGNTAKVVAVVDHHVDEGQHLDANPRIVKMVGSCGSLVVELFKKDFETKGEGKGPVVPGPLADLLLSSIVIDTGLKPTPKGKATPDDLDAVQLLLPYSSYNVGGIVSLNKLGENLSEKKTDVGSLSSRDLLRRDYKEYVTDEGWRFGLSTVPISFSDWIKKSSSTAGGVEEGWKGIEDDVRSWMKERNLSLAGVLTGFKYATTNSDPKGKHGREMLVCVGSEKLMSVFKGLEKDGEVQLKKWKSTEKGLGLGLKKKTKRELGADVGGLGQGMLRVYTQGNTKASRKQVAPLVMKLVKLVPSPPPADADSVISLPPAPTTSDTDALALPPHPIQSNPVRDFKRLSSDPPGGISGAPCADNIMIWNAVIFGPADTPFEDGTFRLVLTFDESYPNKPPTVKFLSKMFHPNVYANGELCLDILQNRWSPTYDVAAILTSVQSLLHDPNPNSPANVEAASLFRDNMKDYVTKVRQTVEASWMDDEL